MPTRTAIVIVLLSLSPLWVGCRGSGIGTHTNNNNNNNNTSQYCGNNSVDTGEECDGSDLAGRTCQSLGYVGGQLTCEPDCTLNETGCDPPPGCGNGVLDPGEDCDGNNLGGADCQWLGYGGGVLACRGSCVFDTSGCEPVVTCGNGVIELPEQCDGNDLGGQSCITRGFAGGVLACRADCFFDESGCVTEVCGDGVIQAPEECDGQDFGGMTCLDVQCTGGILSCANDCTISRATCTGCQPICGNGVVEGTEECDTNNLDGETCVSLGYAGGTLACTLACHFDVTGCLTQVCGNGVAEGTEECDGNDLNGQTCVSLGYPNPSGTLSCTGQCTFDISGCTSACAAAEQANTHFGCEFWAADLPNWFPDDEYVIVLQNPSLNTAANVTISDANGVLATLNVPADGQQLYVDTTRTLNLSAAGVSANGIRIQSDRPIAVFQYNELGTNVATTDTSLLLPVHGLGKRYYTMDYTARDDDDSYIAVVGTQAGTVVTIFPTSPVNGQTTANLNAHDVLMVTVVSQGDSLTGSRVEATQPVAVFAGNLCANVPTNVSYCDHLEEQIFPRLVLGTSYVVGKTAARGICDPDDRVRVVADANGTTVTFNPPVAGPWNLDEGDWMETSISESVYIVSNHPILVGQFLEGPGAMACDNEGDPAFMLVPPTVQFTVDFTSHAATIFTSDYLNILAPIGTTVNLDGASVTLSSTNIGGSGFTATSVPVTDGRHRITANQPIGVLAYGYEGEPLPLRNVSYGYPIGMRLDVVNPVE